VFAPELDLAQQPSPHPELAHRLWTSNQDLARACLQHPFVRHLADGSLPPAQFRAYVAQDAYFLEAFARAYAFALARCPDRHGLEAFQGLIAGVVDELKLHTSYASRRGVDLRRTTPARATLAYTDFLLATAAVGSVGEVCAAMTPCMRLYAYLGQTLAQEGAVQGSNPYREWVETYAAAGFESLAATLEGLLDRYAHESPTVRSCYRRAMQLELDFFSYPML
jgi:thiaminase (transcriptional activator TenA)